jgi:polyvinyl alcohol dehydrogenase (cytochrome)
MNGLRSLAATILVVLIGGWSAPCLAQSSLAGIGGFLYRQHCAQCHDDARDRTPPRDVLSRLPPETIVAALMSGSMKAQGDRLGAEEIGAIVVFLTGKSTGAADQQASANRCTREAGPIDLDAPQWRGWGNDLDNSRFQPNPGFSPGDVPKLKVKWAFGYAGIMTYGQPVPVGDRVFVSSMTGQVFALDAQTGCTYWSFTAKAAVRTAITLGRSGATGSVLAYLADEGANVYALDAQTGSLVWHHKLSDHRFARVIGAPALHAGRLYVPESSPEEAVSRSPDYPCCTFRGSVTALDAATGVQLWKTFVIPEEPKPYKVNAKGTAMLGPAGAAIWSAPTVDRKRGVLYVGTGNSYTEVATAAADAIVAIDLESGAIRWTRQVTPHDDYLVGCSDPRAPNQSCPTALGPDFDFGSSPILRRLPDGRDLILAGQKSGTVYALDPDRDGAVVWQVDVGRGTALGGVEWGPAADQAAIYVAISDVLARGQGRPGLTALELASGRTLWHSPAPPPACGIPNRRCTPAQSAAVTAIPGVVFSGSQDGHLRAYASGDGAIVWDYDTAQSYETVNGAPARGGSLDTAGPTIANGMLYVNSGYGKFVGMPGNVLLAFTVDGR